MTGLLTQYLGRGPLADRPESPVIADGTLALYQDDTGLIYSWNPIQEAWEGFTGGVTDVPDDGKPYLRFNGEWLEYVEPEPPVIPDVPVQEAPEDGESYMRKNGEWFKYVPPVIPELPDNLVTEAPEDGDQYVRSDGAWEKVVIPEGEGFPEAPQDGKIYGRKNGAWAEVVATGGGDGGGTVPVESPNQAPHKYWRVYSRANNGDGYTGLSEVYFRDAAGQEFPPSMGVIIKSGEAPNGNIGPAVQAFDRNTTNRWEVPVPVGAWIGLQYQEAVKVRRLTLTSGNQYPAQMMKNFDIQWSDDGITWTTRWSHDNITAWGTSETRNFADPVTDPVSTAIPSPVGKAGQLLAVAANGRELEWSGLGEAAYPRFRYMRIRNITNWGDGASSREVYFRRNGINLPKPTIVADNSSGEYPFSKAINGVLTDFWSTYGVGTNVVVDLDFGAVVEMDEFISLSRTDSYQQAIRSLEFLFSEDGISYGPPIMLYFDLAGWTVGGATRSRMLPKTRLIESTSKPTPPSRWTHGNGERRAIMFCTSIGAGGGSPQNLLSGVAGNYFWFANGADPTRDLRVDFGVPNILQGWSMMMDGTDANGIWTVEGSNDQVAWTPIINDYRLGGVGYGPGVLPVSGAIYTRDFVNDMAFRYWRIRLNAGQATTQNRYITFLGFKCQPL